MAEKRYSFKAALFDLDGVVLDTESQYTLFWGQESRCYHPEIPGLEHKIKGQTLTEILDRYFGDVRGEHADIIKRLDDFEHNMTFNYIKGFEDFANQLRRHSIGMAVVTSSNLDKMASVYSQHPEFKDIFDAILTSENFDESKPSPDCYLKGAAKFGVKPEECIVFEDSFNGLKSGRASGAYVVGLSTTNKPEDIAPLADIIIPDYTSLRFENGGLEFED